MSLSLVQFQNAGGTRGVAVMGEDGQAAQVHGVASTLQLAHRALREGETLASLVGDTGEFIDLAKVRLLPPIDHADAAHLWLTGTGLTHFGSADCRDKMHRAGAEEGHLTDSMKMFRMGVEGGKPQAGKPGVQPEWFYKGDGTSLVAPGEPISSPDFALDGGEEPEIAGIYLVDADGTPVRLGYALANEFSDHVAERSNYLWLAHSKLRPAAIGPELLLGELPQHVAGTSRVLRGGEVIWEKPFLSGEANMSHSLANLEHHHFKYRLFRRPGDVHVHFFGTATLSFSDGVCAQDGDVFEIVASPFRLPLRNTFARASTKLAQVRAL